MFKVSVLWLFQYTQRPDPTVLPNPWQLCLRRWRSPEMLAGAGGSLNISTWQMKPNAVSNQIGHGSNRYVRTSIIETDSAIFGKDEHNWVSGQGNITWWQWRTKPAMQKPTALAQRFQHKICLSAISLVHGFGMAEVKHVQLLGLSWAYFTVYGIQPLVFGHVLGLKLGMTPCGTSSSWMLIFLRRLLVYKFVAHSLYFGLLEVLRKEMLKIKKCYSKSKGNTCACDYKTRRWWGRKIETQRQVLQGPICL